MKQRRTHKEINQDIKEHYGGLAEHPPDPKASEWFRKPPYQVANLILAQTGSMHNRTLSELLDYLFDEVNSGRLSGTDTVPDDVIEYIRGGNIDILEYIADKYDISGGDASGQNSPD